MKTEKCWLVLLAFMFASCPAQARTKPVTVVIGGSAVSCAVAPFLDSSGQVCVPVEVVRLLGASFAPTSDEHVFLVRGANGVTVSATAVLRDGQPCVPLQTTASALGAEANWQPDTRTLTLRARLQSVRQQGNTLSLSTTYPVRCDVESADNPPRVFVTLYGVDLSDLPPVALPEDSEVQRIRPGQMDFSTVRLALDLKHSLPGRVASHVGSADIQVALGASSIPLVARNTAPASVKALPPPASSSPAVSLVPAPAPTGVQITDVRVNRVSPALTQVLVTATGPAPFRTETLRAPNRLAFDLPGATLNTAVSSVLSGDNGIIRAVRAGIFHAADRQYGRIVVDLEKMVAFTVSTQAGPGATVLYTLNIPTASIPALSTSSSPNSSSPKPAANEREEANSLAGKIVVVDPGHGAEDSGAIAPDGTMEKTLTLSIGRKLRDTLTASGATVFMTRDDDVRPSVIARPLFAVAHHADYFVSIHCDASGVQNAHTGTTVYFHARNAVCRRMAEDIVSRIAAVSGIPSAGVKSDTIRFQMGFGVLRGSPMPAVLVECGYLNNDNDIAQLKNDAAQQRIADGIVAGLRDFVADRAAP